MLCCIVVAYTSFLYINLSTDLVYLMCVFWVLGICKLRSIVFLNNEQCSSLKSGEKQKQVVLHAFYCVIVIPTAQCLISAQTVSFYAQLHSEKNFLLYTVPLDLRLLTFGLKALCITKIFFLSEVDHRMRPFEQKWNTVQLWRTSNINTILSINDHFSIYIFF